MFNRFERQTDVKIHHEGMVFVASSNESGVPYDWFASHPAHAHSSPKVLAISTQGHVVEVDLSDADHPHPEYAYEVQEVLNEAVRRHRLHTAPAKGFPRYEASLDAFIVSVLKKKIVPTQSLEFPPIYPEWVPSGFDPVLYP